MTRSTIPLAFIIGGLIGMAGAVTGFVIGGLPGELAGLTIAWAIAAIVGVWIGTR